MEINLGKNVLIIGAGWVGSQLAARLAQHGLSVLLADESEDRARCAMDTMRSPHFTEFANSQIPVERWLPSIRVCPPLSELESRPDLCARWTIDFVIECVPEQISLKKRVLRQASRLFPPPTIIASNSSYFVPSLLGQFVEHPERFAHFHLHVPVLKDSVADICGGPETSPETLEKLKALSEEIGQAPLVLNREHPGYVFNWMLQAMLKAALELSAQDVADPEDIDRSWKAVTGMPLGPFGMMDRIGLDVIEQVLANSRWADASTVSEEQLLTMIRVHTRQGNLGTKTGSGFYQYSTDATE